MVLFHKTCTTGAYFANEVMKPLLGEIDSKASFIKWMRKNLADMPKADVYL